jgi:WD40 repeat protein
VVGCHDGFTVFPSGQQLAQCTHVHTATDIASVDIDTVTGNTLLTSSIGNLCLWDLRMRAGQAAAAARATQSCRVMTVRDLCPHRTATFAPGSSTLALVVGTLGASPPELWDLRQTGKGPLPPPNPVHAQADAMRDVWRSDSEAQQPVDAHAEPAYNMWSSMWASRAADADSDGERDDTPLALAAASPVSEARSVVEEFAGTRLRCVRQYSSSSTRTAPVWNAASKSYASPFTGHGTSVCAGAFTPDGRCVVTAGVDGQQRMWRADTGAGVRTWTSRWWDAARPPSTAMDTADGGRLFGLVVFGSGSPVHASQWLLSTASDARHGVSALWDLDAPPLRGGPRAGLESGPPLATWADHRTPISAAAATTEWGGCAIATGDVAGNVCVRRAGDAWEGAT